MIIGITGNFGVGKTTVANMFRRLGAEVIDADQIAHSIIMPYSLTYRRIVSHFGRGILSGIYISRRKLAKVAFSDKKKLKRLNEIIHPEILKVIKNRMKRVSKREILVIDAALLIECGLLPWVDKLVVVDLKPKIQFRRLSKREMRRDDAKERIGFQYPQVKKMRYADFIIDNSGTRRHTEKQVKNIWNEIVKQVVI